MARSGTSGRRCSTRSPPRSPTRHRCSPPRSASGSTTTSQGTTRPPSSTETLPGSSATSTPSTPPRSVGRRCSGCRGWRRSTTRRSRHSWGRHGGASTSPRSRRRARPARPASPAFRPDPTSPATRPNRCRAVSPDGWQLLRLHATVPSARSLRLDPGSEACLVQLGRLAASIATPTGTVDLDLDGFTNSRLHWIEAAPSTRSIAAFAAGGHLLIALDERRTRSSASTSTGPSAPGRSVATI